MKSLILTLAACALVRAAGDTPFAGDWMGTLDVNGQPIRVALCEASLLAADERR
jgi:hypothetical protein